MLPNSRRLILQLFGHFSGDFEHAVEKKPALIEALLCKFTRPIHTKTGCLNRAFAALLGDSVSLVIVFLRLAMRVLCLANAVPFRGTV